MKKTFLIIDSDYLCHAAFYKLGVNNHGVILGFLSTVLRLHKQFKTNRFVFCFDSPTSRRKEIYPQYKANRHQFKSEKDVKDYAKYVKEVLILRTKILPALGYVNIQYQEGHEADDLIASVCRSIKTPNKGIIISTDKDLYQCLRPYRVYMCNLRTSKWIAFDTFKKMYGVTPKDWIFVKATAGCSSDNITGIPGIGEKSAIKYLLKQLKSNSSYYKKIRTFLLKETDKYTINKQLVTLPYPGTEIHPLRKPRTTIAKWKKAVKRWRFLSTLSFTVNEYKQFIEGSNQ